MTPFAVSHRGAKGYWTENSLTGFHNTVALAPPAVEFDVHQTADGALVVLHDCTLDRTTTGSGHVEDLTLAELRHARLRDLPDEPIPTLDEVLDIVAPSGMELQIEIKPGRDDALYQGLEARLCDMIAARGLQEQVLVTSFFIDALHTVQRIAPEQRIVNSLNAHSARFRGGLRAAVDATLSLPNSFVAIEKTDLAPIIGDLAAQYGAKRLGVWTLKTEGEWHDWAGQPLRHVITDMPPEGHSLK